MKYSSNIEKANFICLASFFFGVQIFASAGIGNENNPFFIYPGRPTSSQGREEVNTFWVPPSVQGDSKNISSNFVDPKYHWEWFECKATTLQLHETPKKQDISPQCFFNFLIGLGLELRYTELQHKNTGGRGNPISQTEKGQIGQKPSQ